MGQQKIKSIKVADLHLWTENPRDPVDSDLSDYDIIRRAIADNAQKWNLQKLVNEMGNYYDYSELPTVVFQNNKYMVYDGNRRIAVLKYLQNQQLYQSLGGGLFFENEPELLRNQTIIPCNVCDLETALNNVERKHSTSGTWKQLESDYFAYKYRNKEKSYFIWFDEQTNGLISKNNKLNQDFVKDEVLTINNLKKIGFGYSSDKGFTHNYSDAQLIDIFRVINELITNKVISTRKNRGSLKEPMIENYPELQDALKPYDSGKNKPLLLIEPKHNKNDHTNDNKNKLNRRTPVTKNDIIFGKKLSLVSGPVNNLYRAIDNIYNTNKNNAIVQPIIAMSLRLILEIAGRIHLSSDGDQVYKQFIKKACKDIAASQQDKNYSVLTQGWLNNNTNLEALLGKYAHGSITATEEDVLKISCIVGDILLYYFGRQE